MAIGRPRAGMELEDPGREFDVTDIREILCAKDTKGSYAFFLQLEQQAREDPALFLEHNLYLEMLKSESSFFRVRGFRMLCAGAKWDTQGVIRENLPLILAQLEDKKPTAVRQCHAASASEGSGSLSGRIQTIRKPRQRNESCRDYYTIMAQRWRRSWVL